MLRSGRALSSAGERSLHTGEVVGSIPTAPTILRLARAAANFWSTVSSKILRPGSAQEIRFSRARRRTLTSDRASERPTACPHTSQLRDWVEKFCDFSSPCDKDSDPVASLSVGKPAHGPL